MFHPVELMSGQALIKAVLVLLSNSCSRMMRPGVFGPVSHVVIEVLIAWSVVPPVAIVQSFVLKMDAV